MSEGVKFIRVNGRVVPIKGKGAKKGPSKNDYKKKDRAAVDYHVKSAKADAAGKAYSKRTDKVARPFAYAGGSLGAGIGAKIAKGSRGKGAAIGAFAGLVAGGIAGRIRGATDSRANVLKKKQQSAERKAGSALMRVGKLNAWDQVGDGQNVRAAQRKLNKNKTGL